MTTVFGSNPNQIPLSGMLGDLAWKNSHWLTVNKLSVRGALMTSGAVLLSLPTSSAPTKNGELALEQTSNTRLTIKEQGSDAVVRSMMVPLDTLTASTLMVDPTTANYPTAEPTLLLNFLNDEVLPGYITVSGGVNGTRVNKFGKVVAASAPRFDYDPVTRDPRGVLIEEARTNLAVSNQGQAGIWAPGANATVTNTYTNPLTGSADGRLFSGASTTTWGAPNNASRQQLGLTSSTTYTGSLWFIPATATSLTLSLRDNSTGTYVTTTQACTPGVPIKLAATITLGAATTSISMLAAGNGDFIGYGDQIELGPFATSTIPTAGATVTRAADVANMTGTNFSDWFNPTQGTFVVEASTLDPTGSSPNALCADNGSTLNRIQLGRTNSAGLALRVFVIDTNVNQVSALGTGTTAAGASARLAFAYATNDFIGAVDGVLTAPDTSGSVPFVDRLRIGANSVPTYLNGHIRSLLYYPVRLPNAQLQALTN